MDAKRPDPETLQKIIAKLEEDLADRRAIERELAHMASFSEMAPNPIVETDTEKTLHYINPAAQEAFPTLTAEGATHAMFAGFAECMAQLRREKQSSLTRALPFDERIYEQRISLLDGGPRVRFYFSDITELKRLDQLKTDFVNMTSHELRSPLTSIQAGIKMVAGGLLGPLTDDQVRALQLATQNIDRLARLVNDLLDVAKIEAGRLELQCRDEDGVVLVQEVARLFEPLARERGLALRAHTPAALRLFVDRDKIIQVLTNLIQNALKFTVQGHIEVALEETEGAALLHVSDTGPGIAPQHLPHLFEKFRQFGHRAKGHEAGTGLGLSLCKGIVELHGGRLTVESELGRGTRFTARLPQAPKG